MFFQTGGNTAYGSSGANSAYNYIYFAVGVFPYLFGCCFLVNGAVGRVVKLLQYDRAGNLFVKFVGFLHSSFHACGSGGENKLCAASPQKIFALFAH